VILPVCNGEKTLGRAVRSILRQTYGNFELLIINNGSSDSTEKVVCGLMRNEKRIRYFVLRKPDLVAALNLGLEKAAGDIVARQDADDYSWPRRLELQAGFMKRHPEISLVSCRCRLVPAGEWNRGMRRYVRWSNSLLEHEKIENNMFFESPFVHPSVMFRKKDVIETGGYRSNGQPEDYGLWLEMFLRGKKFKKLEEVLYDWHDSPHRLTRTDERYSKVRFDLLKAEYLSQYLGRKSVRIWGRGKSARKFSRLLGQKGVRISGYVDIDREKIGREVDGARIHAPGELLRLPKLFTLGCVRSPDSKPFIRKTLDPLGYIEGKDYVFVY
ncbi:MAG TPA: glycosyltransferase, partial [bacterium]|nr:glycosyltransferase [bacterium]